ncbi:MAG: energy-coupling factor ABC transporter ATP-binding protein [Desulfobacterales bacterium]
MGEILYEMIGLRHLYRERLVLQIDRLEIPRGAMLGVIGPNGGGKSTLLKLAGMVEKPCTGTILFDGRPAEPFAPQVRQRVTLMPQEPFLLKRTVFSNVAYGLRVRNDLARLEARVHQALAWVGLNGSDFGDRPWYALSGGEAQRVALASRLILKPGALLLDEPTANVDALSTQLIKEAALRARQEWGTTLIIASHDHPWLQESADSILHLFKGRRVGTGRENILFGPWEPMESGGWCKRLPDGQRLRVPPPPDDTSAALIADAVLKPFSGTSPSGVVTRLALDHGSGKVLASVNVGRLPFTVAIDGQEVQRLGIHPGCRVEVDYDPAQITWV